MDGAAKNVVHGLGDTIEGMVVTTVALPVTSTRNHGIGAVGGDIHNVLVKLETDGLTAWGEASPWAAFTGTAEAAAGALDVHLRPLIVGRRISETAQIMVEADAVLVGHPEAKAALEMALYDLIGKAANLSVSELLGGRVRDELPLSVSIANPDFDADLELAERIVDDGVRLFKIKPGVAGHTFDLMRLETLKKRFPEVEIRIDYNQGLTPIEAMKFVPDIDTFEPGFIEQPVRAQNWEAMKNIRAAIRAPLVADESIFTPADALRAAKEGIADAFSIKIMKSGGIRKCQEIASIAAAAGIAGYGGDMFETGLAHLAGVHLVATAPNISLGCEFYQATYYLETDLLETPFPVSNGKITVPVTPGLGINIDEDKVRHFAIDQQN